MSVDPSLDRPSARCRPRRLAGFAYSLSNLCVCFDAQGRSMRGDGQRGRLCVDHRGAAVGLGHAECVGRGSAVRESDRIGDDLLQPPLQLRRACAAVDAVDQVLPYAGGVTSAASRSAAICSHTAARDPKARRVADQPQLLADRHLAQLRTGLQLGGGTVSPLTSAGLSSGEFQARRS